MNTKATNAALFDLDGVLFDTEHQYSIFWKKMGKIYHPEIENFCNKIKGQTLVQIFNRYFNGNKELQQSLSEAIDEYESSMEYRYVPGVQKFLKELRKKGIQTAVVTSSNRMKMNNVYQAHPEFKDMFDYILTAESFASSKPDPDCYLQAAQKCKARPEQCVVFEDSFNGLESGRRAGMKVVGLATTNSPDSIKGLANVIISDFTEYSIHEMERLLAI